MTTVTKLRWAAAMTCSSLALGLASPVQADTHPSTDLAGSGPAFLQETPPPPTPPYPPYPEPQPYPDPREEHPDPFIPGADSVSPYDQNRDGCVSNAELAATLNGMDPAGSSASDGNRGALLGSIVLDLLMGTCED